MRPMNTEWKPLPADTESGDWLVKTSEGVVVHVVIGDQCLLCARTGEVITIEEMDGFVSWMEVPQ